MTIPLDVYWIYLEQLRGYCGFLFPDMFWLTLGTAHLARWPVHPRGFHHCIAPVRCPDQQLAAGRA